MIITRVIADLTQDLIRGKESSAGTDMQFDYRERASTAYKDLSETISNPAMWIMLGWLDLKRQYRRTFLGPVWLTVSTAITLGAFALVWSQIFDRPIKDYLPKVAIGYVIFSLVSQCMVDGSKSLIVSSSVMIETRIPKLSILLRHFCGFVFMFLHHFLVTVVIVITLIPADSIRAGEAAIAISLITLNGFFCQTSLAIVCMRFRDLPLVVTNIMQIMFLVSPVLWVSSDLSGQAAEVLRFNPIAVAIEMVRNPLIGNPSEIFHWFFAILFTCLNFLIATCIFIVLRHRIPYWV